MGVDRIERGMHVLTPAMTLYDAIDIFYDFKLVIVNPVTVRTYLRYV